FEFWLLIKAFEAMAYRPSDSSGTDDDLLPPHMNRMPRGGDRFATNGRFSAGKLLNLQNDTDMEARIRRTEQEAYCAVLRAFIAQSDAVSWEKEGLISELRKELRVSDMEHRALLGKVNRDDVLKRIRCSQWMFDGIMMVPLEMNRGPAGHNEKNLANHGGKGKGFPKGQSANGYASFQMGARRKKPENIELRETDKLIKEVERVCRDHPDPSVVENAKTALRDQEQSLMEAIKRLESDEEDCRMPHSSHTHPNQEKMWRSRQVNGNGAYNNEDIAGGQRGGGSNRNPMVGDGGVASDDPQEDDYGDEDELISGKEAILRQSGVPLAGKTCLLWAQIKPLIEGEDREEKLKKWTNPNLKGVYPNDSVLCLATIAKACVEEDPGTRTTLPEIV
ncbi:hypothetical protein KI387_003234, partial [Taxus chinensis]